MQQAGGFNIPLPNGQKVDISTEEGADHFLLSTSHANFFSTYVGKMINVSSKRKLNAMDKHDLHEMYTVMTMLIQNASMEVVQEFFPQSTVQAFMGHVIDQLTKFAQNRSWINTGNLTQYEQALLMSCTSLMYNPVAAALAYEEGSEFFGALADLVKARKGTGRALPSKPICEFITMIVSSSCHARMVAICTTSSTSWTTEKAFEKLESTGILEQFLRCVTVPIPFLEPGIAMFLDQLQECTPFISKKFQPGEPCGDTLIAILAGKDGSVVKRPEVLQRLQAIHRIASSVGKYECGDGYKMCHKCGKSDVSDSFQNALMRCARCHQAYYCSKDCQRADWKVHKKSCVPRTKKEVKKSMTADQMLQDFVLHQYAHIMMKMMQVCDQTGLPMKEMMLELNFVADANGVVPAMQSKPEFKIAPIKDYIEGSRPAEPDWLNKTNIKNHLRTIKEKYNMMQPNMIMCLMNYDGGISTTNLFMVDPDTKEQWFSEEALKAFKAYIAIFDRDDGPLSEIIGPQTLKEVKLKLFTHYNRGKPEGMEELAEIMEERVNME